MEIPISASVHTLSQTWHGFENQGQGFTLGDYLIIHRHTSFYCPSFTWLHFSDTAFLKKKNKKLKVGGNPIVSKTMGCHFSNSICSLSLCHISVILAVFQIFSLLLYLLWSVISDFWCCFNSLKAQIMVSIL